jgi:deoxyadenosine/deoxycytidine kinase
MKNWVRPLIWVEGIIGCGKSTFAREIGKRLELRMIEEPVETNYYLGPFYKDPKRYAFGFQIFMLHQRYAMQQLAAYEATGIGGYKGAILDRSISGDRVFAKMHMQAGNIDELDYKTYEMAYSVMCRTLLPPTLLVFLDVQPETAYRRMQKRDRPEEKGVQLEYLIQLRSGYQDLLNEADSGLMPWSHAVKVSRLVWDPDTTTQDMWDMVARTVRGQCRLGE